MGRKDEVFLDKTFLRYRKSPWDSKGRSSRAAYEPKVLRERGWITRAWACGPAVQRRTKVYFKNKIQTVRLVRLELIAAPNILQKGENIFLTVNCIIII